MLFQVVHTHPLEKCPAQSAEQAKQFGEWWQSLKKATGIKILSGYVTPADHTFYITVEAEDFELLMKGLGPLVGIGTGHISPVMTLERVFPLAESGAFRAQK